MTAVWKRLIVIFALVGVVGTAAAFRGGALPGPDGPRLAEWHTGIWMNINNLAGYPGANARAGSFRTVRAGTLVGIEATVQVASSGAGSWVVAITDSSGNVQCSMTAACNSAASATASATCSAQLAANTQYEWRATTICAATTFNSLQVNAGVSIP